MEVAAPLEVDGPRLTVGIRKVRLVRCAGGTLRVPVGFEAPALTRGDGPIGACRRWCRQFYPKGGGPRAA